MLCWSYPVAGGGGYIYTDVLAVLLVHVGLAQARPNKEAADSLRRSGLGIESDDDLDGHEIFVSFKWFEALHAVMRTPAVVSPPALLDTSASERSTLSSLDLQDQVEPEEEQQAEEEETQISEQAIASSTVGTQAQLESDQPGPSGSSASVAHVADATKAGHK